MSLADQPAFPHEYGAGKPNPECTGMTYRQWLVGMALQGLCARLPALSADELVHRARATGSAAVVFADAAVAAQEE